MSRARASLRGLWAAPVALLALLAGGPATAGVAYAAPAERQAAATDLYVAPDATPGGNGSAGQPFATIDQARQPAHVLSADSDVVVHLAGGTYRLSKPLAFGSGDGGQNGHTITYQAAAGQQPVVSGAQSVTGWQVHDQTKNIWSVHVGTGITTRQLYVNGKQASRAAVQVPCSAFTFTQTGLTVTDSSLDYLAGLSDQSHMEVESINSFTDRYAPVQSISGRTLTMRQPAWNNNSWGYDTVNAPFAGGKMYLENNYAFLQQAGQWYLDASTGDLYYRAEAGQNPNSLDVELPGLQSLLGISGSYDTSSGGGGFPTGYHRLEIGNDSLCLDVYGNSGSAGAAIDQWTCNGQSNQQFQFVPGAGGYGQLQAQNSGLVVGVAGGSTTAGTPDIVQQAPSGATGALWRPVRQSDGSYSFQNQNSGLCLDVHGGGSNLGQQLDLWPCKNTAGGNQDPHAQVTDRFVCSFIPTHCPAPVRNTHEEVLGTPGRGVDRSVRRRHRVTRVAGGRRRTSRSARPSAPDAAWRLDHLGRRKPLR
ncbi:RICIN domain-containing protein [Streptomyces sp. NPDC050564]|uniref:RICIN domain-containing protein n=1 Tax=Streptomyces sp. NPDC050564 TaxID=3365631 RepID=UPI00378DC3DE